MDELDWAFALLALYTKHGKPPCLYPEPDGGRCCECAACQAQPIPAYDEYLEALDG